MFLALETTGHPLPAEGAATEILPGLHWICQPLPFALDHVNLWALEDGPGWTLVDAGIQGSRGRTGWEQVFADTMRGRAATRMLVTHFHPDHMGLAHWLCERFGIELWTSQAEWLLARMLHRDDSPELLAAITRFYGAMGLSADEEAALVGRGNAYARGVPRVPASYRRLRQGDRLHIGGRDWEVVIGGGHSPEHVCLVSAEAGVLIAGDMVLPGISPNVSVWALEPEGDPLTDFLHGLARLRALPDSLLVLPSHGRPFHGLHTRIDQLVAHHDQRLDEVLTACAETPRTVGEVTRLLFRRTLDAHQLSFATGEALAHLNHLLRRGDLARDTGPDGIWRFRRR